MRLFVSDLNANVHFHEIVDDAFWLDTKFSEVIIIKLSVPRR